MDRRVAADGTLIRRALAPTGAGIEAAVAAASVPPLSGGPGGHGSGAAHAFTIADKAPGSAASSTSFYRGVCQLCRSVSDLIDPEWLHAAQQLEESTRLRREIGLLPGAAANMVGLAYIAAA
jgi:hypothetical protein